MGIQHSSWSYCKISLMLYHFSSVLDLFSCSLFLAETLLVSFIFSDLFFGMKGLILKSLMISPIISCRYLSSGNIKYSVKPLSRNSKVLADISGPTNWRDVLTQGFHKGWLFLLLSELFTEWLYHCTPKYFYSSVLCAKALHLYLTQRISRFLRCLCW